MHRDPKRMIKDLNKKRLIHDLSQSLKHLHKVPQNTVLNILVVRRNDLSAVRPINFVAVVFLWIMRRCHHYATKSILFCNAEWNERRRRHFAVQVDWDVVVNEDCRSQFGESKKKRLETDNVKVIALSHHLRLLYRPS